MNENKEVKAVELWLDQSIGKIMVKGKPDTILHLVDSNYETRVREEGESPDVTLLGAYRATNNEFTKHNKKRNALRLFYKSLVKALEPYEKIDISGTGTKPAEFFNFITAENLLHGKEVVLLKAVS